MTRVLIIPAAFALLTFTSANAQEMNEDATSVNASKAAMFDEVPADQDGMSVQELNELQRARLEQDALEIAEIEGDAPVVVAETPESEEEAIFTEVGEEVIVPEEEVTVVEVSGPYDESEIEATQDGDMTQPADETPEQ